MDKLYHGTSSVVDVSDGIQPPMATGVLREGWRRKDLHKVFMTDSVAAALRYARKACEKFGGFPVVYEVEPEGDVWHVQNDYLADSAKVVGWIGADDPVDGCLRRGAYISGIL